MVNLAIFGTSKIDGSMLDPGERVVSFSLFGGTELDFATLPPPPALEVVIIAVFGEATVRIRPEQSVRLSGFSVFGGRQIEPRRPLPPPTDPPPAVEFDDDLELPLDITAYALFGGVSVKRQDGPQTRS